MSEWSRAVGITTGLGLLVAAIILLVIWWVGTRGPR